jgi:phosphoglycolate phosphatase
VKNTQDPIEVFIQAAHVSPELAARVEAELTDQEVTAAATARPTPYVHEVLAACRESGRTIAVVSNNSARAVNAYLDRHGLAESVALVVARTSSDPALLKPSPHLLGIAIEKLAADPAATALVGDSLTDIEAAHRAGIASIGYANKPGKHEAMTNLNAGAIITSMADLALSLRAHPMVN